MKALVTGAAGFAGSHLIAALARRLGGPIDGAYRPGIEILPEATSKLTRPHALDVTDPEGCRAVLARVKPTHLFHLAGPAQVGDSYHQATEVVRTVVLGAVNLLEAAATLPEPPRVLLISSAEVYGDSARTVDPLTEETAPLPNSPYAAAKLASEAYAIYATRQGRVPTVIARPFNHIGPRQSPAFVASAFAKQIAEAELAGAATTEIRVGNLSAERDFTDVRDIVEGYVLLAERGTPGEVYNLTSGECLRTGQLLERLLARSKASLRVTHDPARDRMVDVPHRRGSAQRARALGWKPIHSLDDTLDALLDSWRAAARA